MNAPFWISYGLLWFFVAFLGSVVIGLTQTFYRVRGLASPAEIDGGSEGPAVRTFVARDLTGEEISGESLVGKRTAILFVSPACPSCAATVEELGALTLKTDGNVLVVCRSTSERCRSLAEMYELDVPVIADVDFRLSKMFGVTSVPTAVVVNADAQVESYGHPRRGEELIELFDSALPSTNANSETLISSG